MMEGRITSLVIVDERAARCVIHLTTSCAPRSCEAVPRFPHPPPRPRRGRCPHRRWLVLSASVRGDQRFHVHERARHGGRAPGGLADRDPLLARLRRGDPAHGRARGGRGAPGRGRPRRGPSTSSASGLGVPVRGCDDGGRPSGSARDGPRRAGPGAPMRWPSQARRLLPRRWATRVGWRRGGSGGGRDALRPVALGRRAQRAERRLLDLPRL